MVTKMYMSLEDLNKGIIGEIGFNEFFVLQAITAFSENENKVATVSISEISKCLGISYSTVNRCINSLVERNYLKKEIVNNPKGGLVNRFTVLDDRFKVM